MAVTRAQVYENPPGFDGTRVIVDIQNTLNPQDQKGIIQAAMHDIAVAYAEKWAETNIKEIYAELDVKAISNIIMLEVAKQVKDNILNGEK